MAHGLVFRVVPVDDVWAYRRGRLEIARYRDREGAVDHASRDAADNAPSEVIVHDEAGHMSVVATFD